MSKPSDGTAPEVTAPEAIALTEGGTWLLDVREQHEWERGHAPLAHLVPLSELDSRMGDIPNGERILVVCHAGGRSRRATAALRAAGLDAVNVAGGMLAWEKSGGGLVSDGPDAARVE